MVHRHLASPAGLEADVGEEDVGRPVDGSRSGHREGGSEPVREAGQAEVEVVAEQQRAAAVGAAGEVKRAGEMVLMPAAAGCV
jgi:hypothetical protein